MSELRRNRGPDDGDKPPDRPAPADKPARESSPEFRTSDQIPGREVDRRKVTPAQREFLRTEKQAADSGVPHKRITTYSMDWSSGDHINGWYDPPKHDKDRPDPADSSDEPEPDTKPDHAESQFPTLQHTNATGVERLRTADTASHDKQPVRDDRRIDPDDHSAPAAPDDDRREPDDPSEEREEGADAPADDLDRTPRGNTPAERRSPYADSSVEFNRDNSGLEARSIQRTDGEFKELKPADATGDNRRRRVMNKVLEKSDTITSKVQDGAKTVDSILSRPPTQPTVGCTPTPTEMRAEQYGAHSPGDTVSALAAGALAVGMVISKMHDKYGARKEQHDGNG